ncbi:sugar phosphate nucleotidyltransferase [Lentisphaerota bacterium ZTH]|nr:mannose-1-phosphate guanylyltransferase [Lentisphaerota bacterium]WET06425.1 sugar phosphate nucleotidyltransferase [Lentisphaerota bacterium ZTH]
MKKENFYAIVMAGGKGERFWPQSRASHPKQLLRLIGNLTLIEQTVERLTPLVPLENIIIVTNHDYVAPMRSLLAKLPADNIIGEPVGRDTAPCVALAAGIVKAKSKSDDAVMLLLPSDHVIRNSASMLQVLSDSGEVAVESKSIVTIGVNPSFASTGYGYIHCGEAVESAHGTKFFKSLGFTEKPNLKTAEKFLKAGTYKWNSGMFIWTLGTIMQALNQFAPELHGLAERLGEAFAADNLENALAEEYQNCEKISIDYAVMEKVDNVTVAECTFDWDDVGSWTALRNQIRPSENNNVVRGLFEGLDAKNCIVVGDAKHLIAAIDVEDLIIVHTDDATLVCNAKSAQRIKELVHRVGQRQEYSKFL